MHKVDSVHGGTRSAWSDWCLRWAYPAYRHEQKQLMNLEKCVYIERDRDGLRVRLIAVL